MNEHAREARALASRITAASLSALLLAFLLLPVVALAISSSPADLWTGVRHPLFAPALWLSLHTSLLSLLLVVLCGTPLAFWLARSDTAPARAVSLAVDLPIVLPPAVVGVALLQTFGRRGLLGPFLDSLGIVLPFTGAAVVLAQLVVSAPFYVQSAANAFRKVDPDLLLAARTLGASPAGAFARVAVPLALPGLVAGASLAWARALGEFGATLLFAGNLAGTTRTLPLAIYTALESDLRAAVAISLVLAGVALVLLLGLRAAPDLLARGSR
ncbi:MAG: ABC transporter permease [Myxococcales bacterium]|jgi:molybdate transport system permease protein